MYINKTQSELIKELVEKLPSIRQEIGISQTDLGKAVGLSRQTISSIERGSVELSWNNYLAIMLFLCSSYKNKLPIIIQEDYENLNEIFKK